MEGYLFVFSSLILKDRFSLMQTSSGPCRLFPTTCRRLVMRLVAAWVGFKSNNNATLPNFWIYSISRCIIFMVHIHFWNSKVRHQRQHIWAASNGAYYTIMTSPLTVSPRGCKKICLIWIAWCGRFGSQSFYFSLFFSEWHAGSNKMRNSLSKGTN